jgi:mRNA interferase MazF
VICDRGTVVVVPFPYTDRTVTKRRPALVMSGRTFNGNGHSLIAMITTTSGSWPLDVTFDWAAAGLTVASIIRLKLFTLDNRLIIRTLGALTPHDLEAVDRNLQRMLDDPSQVMPRQ